LPFSDNFYDNNYSKRVNFLQILEDDVSDYMVFYNYKRFYKTLNYKKLMNVYWDSIKINDENYTKLDDNVA